MGSPQLLPRPGNDNKKGAYAPMELQSIYKVYGCATFLFTLANIANNLPLGNSVDA
jgi:hypothetical protein